MPTSYERAVDDLLEAIRTHLHHQHDRTPTDTAVAAYIRRSDPVAIQHDLTQYPECRTAARYLKRGRANRTHVLYVMLWGRVNEWAPSTHADNDRTDTPHSE
jgi:hypothetical protein